MLRRVRWAPGGSPTRPLAPAAILLVLFASLGAQAGHIDAYWLSDDAGWFAQRFTTTDERITVSYGIVGRGELFAQTVHLYDATGALLRQRTDLYVSGNAIDLALGAAGAGASTDGTFVAGNSTAKSSNIIFLCNASCNPTREFVLVVTGAGNVTAWDAALSLTNVALLGNASGLEAFALSSRSFDAGVASASATALGEGATLAQAATHRVHADDAFVGAYRKSGAPALQRMSIETPTGAMACPCTIGKGAPGDYTFRLDDADVRGDEAYVSWADVRFP